MLSKHYTSYFAFAEEKLDELAQLKELAQCEDYHVASSYQANTKLFAQARDCVNEDVHQRLSRITEDDYIRKPSRNKRQVLQKQKLALPEFPTTTIGSFPQTNDVKVKRSTYRKGEVSETEYKEFIKKKITECVRWQEEIGLDVLVHGEYERNDMVEYFGEALGGFLFTEKAWVQSYGTRCVKPPIIWGDVYREKTITIEWSVYAQSLTKKAMKGMLTGPVTILNWSFPREDISIKESISQIALAIRDEVLDLEKNGIKIIQIDEAALREKLPLRKSDWQKEYLDFAIPAFRLTHSGVRPETQSIHICVTVSSQTLFRRLTIWTPMSLRLKHPVLICKYSLRCGNTTLKQKWAREYMIYIPQGFPLWRKSLRPFISCLPKSTQPSSGSILTVD